MPFLTAIAYLSVTSSIFNIVRVGFLDTNSLAGNSSITIQSDLFAFTSSAAVKNFLWPIILAFLKFLLTYVSPTVPVCTEIVLLFKSSFDLFS